MSINKENLHLATEQTGIIHYFYATMKKIAIIGSSGIPPRYGGFETLTFHLVMHLGEKFRWHVYCSKKYYPKNERVYSYQNARLHYIPLNANGFQSIFYDVFSLIHSLKYADIILILGISATFFLPLIKPFLRKKILVHMDGIEWNRKKWNKLAKTYLKYSEKMAVKYADHIISDNEAIQQYLKETYNAPSVLLSYGGNTFCDKTASVQEDHQEYYEISKKWKNAYALCITRIEPENNIEMILETFSRMPDIPLIFVGNWGHSHFAKELFKKYIQYPNIYLRPAVYNASILSSLRKNAKFYIHGNSAGGTNPGLVEAMYEKMAVISYDVIYNRSTTANNALYFKTHQELLALVRNTHPDKRNEIKKELWLIASKKYNWEEVTKNYASLFLDQVK